MDKHIDQSPGSVLVVDDAESIREYLTVSIRSLGIEVVALEDGQQGLEFLKGETGKHCFLVISDYKMTGMDGLEFAAHVRDFDGQLPLVLLTGFADKDDTIKGSAGAVPAARPLHVLCHEFESALDKLKRTGVKPGESFVSVMIEAHELAMALISDLKHPKADAQALHQQVDVLVHDLAREQPKSMAALWWSDTRNRGRTSRCIRELTIRRTRMGSGCQAKNSIAS